MGAEEGRGGGPLKVSHRLGRRRTRPATGAENFFFFFFSLETW